MTNSENVAVSTDDRNKMMRKDLDDAAKALAEGDIVEMLRVYQSLKETTG